MTQAVSIRGEGEKTSKNQTTVNTTAMPQLPLSIINSRKFKNFSVTFEGKVQMNLKCRDF